MGNITKTTAGTFQVTVNDIHGKRLRKTFKLKKDAGAFISKIENPKYQQMLITNNLKKKRISFHDSINDFLNTKSNLSKKSIKKYQFTMKQFQYFLDSLNIKYLDEFTPDHGTLLQSRLKISSKDSNGNEVSANPKTINGFIGTVKAMFKDEVTKDHVSRNPLMHIKNLKEEKPRPEYYTVEELKAFFDVDMKKEYRNAFCGLLYTGVRFSELANITWNDVDLNRKLIFIRPKEGNTLKTSNAQRAIPLNDVLYNILVQLSQNKISDIYPFCSVNGRKLKERKLLEAAKRVGEKAGISSRVFLHKFRHTFATMLIQRKSPIEAVQKLMGHASILETMIYVHVKTEVLHDEVNLLNNIFTKTPTNEGSNIDSNTNIFHMVPKVA